MSQVEQIEHRTGAGFAPPGDRVLAELAARQHGVVGRRQLLAIGVTRGAIRRRLTAGRLHPIYLGVYAVGHRAITRHGRWMAAVLACGDGALLSHRSAAALWGLSRPWGLGAGAAMDVTVHRGQAHNRPGIVVHRSRRIDDDDRSRRDGIPVTAVARTLLDLAGTVGRRRLNQSWEEADRLGLLDLKAVAQLCERAGGRRGARLLGAVLADHRGPAPATRSELERRFLRLCREAGLPAPAVNVLVDGLEADAVWEGRRLVVELDGYAYHRTRASFERDRRRDEQLQLAGYRVLRVTHRRLADQPGSVVRAIRSLLAYRGE